MRRFISTALFAMATVFGGATLAGCEAQEGGEQAPGQQPGQMPGQAPGGGQGGQGGGM